MYVSYLIYNSDVTCSEHCLKVFETGVYPGPCKASQNGKGCYIKWCSSNGVSVTRGSSEATRVH